MAHLIGEEDHMLSVGQVPWHGLGTVLRQYPNTMEAMKIARLDWSVEKAPLKTTDGVHVEGYYAIRRRDLKQHILGVVTEDYEVVQNAEAFAIGDLLLGEGMGRVETAGSLRQCRTVWMLFRLSGEEAVIGNDTVETYLLATTSHDGTQALTWMPTNVRVVCNNTLSWALSDRRRAYRFVHRESINEQMAEATQYIKWAASESRGTVDIFRRMASREMAGHAVGQYFEAVFPTPQSAEQMVENEYGQRSLFDRRGNALLAAKQKAEKDRAECRGLMETGAGTDIRGVKGTVWCALNAVTEYVDHRIGTKQSQEENMWRRLYGGGAETKRRAYREAVKLLR